MRKKNVLAILLIIFSLPSFSQNNIGLYPTSVKWKQIIVPSGKVIYPEGLDSLAFRTAALMNYERIHDSSLVRTGNTKKVPVILQNLSTYPAGFSTPAPWRSEYALTPPQNLFLGPTNYFDALTIHEYRHTEQFHMANQGLSLPYKILMGQTGWLINSLFLQPLWLREGDAVTMETIYTNGGRGRLPSFHMEYRAMRLSGYHFNYEKGSWSSFKDFVPNPYHTGYYMITKARRDYGEDYWQKILFDTYHKKGFIYPLTRSMKQFGGLSSSEFYQATVRELDSLWAITDASIHETPSILLIEPQKDVYTNYRFPHYLNDSTIVALKYGFQDINTYYLISGGEEKKLFLDGIYTTDHFTMVLEGNLMTWAESGFDERWVDKDYSVIKLYDFTTGKIKKLTSKTRYFSPAASHDGKTVAATETDLANHFSIQLLDASNGNMIKKFPNEENNFYTQLRWKDDKHLLVVALNKVGSAIQILNVDDGSFQTVLDFTPQEITRPFGAGNYIFFSGGFTGIDNIYAFKLSTKEIFKVTDVRFGAFEPVISPDGKKLAFTEYTGNGYELREMKIDPSQWKKVEFPLRTDIHFHDELVKQEGIDLTKKDFSENYEVKKYPALTSGLFNVYGWLPLPNIPEYGAEFYIQNIMSSLRGTLGVLYNTNNQGIHSYLKLTYAGFYPLIDVGYNYGFSRNINELYDTIPSVYVKEPWKENSVFGGLRFPFRLTQGRYFSNLEIAGYGEYYNVALLDSNDESKEITGFSFPAVKGMLNFSRLLPQARQQVRPRFGQVFFAQYERALDDDPKRFYTYAQLYFPGILKTHSLNFRVAYKNENVTNTFRFNDDFIMPRGYKTAPFENIYLASINYEFPIWYPDLAAASVAFFQRIRFNVFFDYGEGVTESFHQPMHSIGGELLIDFRLFRLFQVTPAFQYSYAFNEYIGEKQPFQFLIVRF
jgi:hypothetical protein